MREHNCPKHGVEECYIGVNEKVHTCNKNDSLYNAIGEVWEEPDKGILELT